jgi:hypothetical protein
MSRKYKYWFAMPCHPDGPRPEPLYRYDAESGRVYSVDCMNDTQPDLVVNGEQVLFPGASNPAFVIRLFVYTTEHHPFGSELAPWFEIRSRETR